MEAQSLICDVSGQSGDELHTRTLPTITDHRLETNYFVFSAGCPYSSVFWRFQTREDVMDYEQLINLVSKRKPLWDTGSETYHNRDVSRRLWSEIAVDIGCSCQLVQTKWQCLRDSFRAEYIKHSKSTTGDGASNKSTSKWKYYKQLAFLADVFAPRKMVTNIPSPDTDTTPSQHSELEDDEPFGSDNEESPPVSETVSADKDPVQGTDVQTTPQANNSKIAPKRCRNTGKNDAIAKRVALEEKELQQFQQLREEKTRTSIDEDEDYHFLMSLLPHLRDVPKKRKLAVRLKFQQVLMEEGRETSVGSWPSPSASHSNSMPQTPSPSYGMQNIDKN